VLHYRGTSNNSTVSRNRAESEAFMPYASDGLDAEDAFSIIEENGGTGEWEEGDLGREVLRLGRSHKRRAKAGADETDAVGARPDFLGDARRDASAGKSGEDAVVEPGVVGAGEKDERRVGEVAQSKGARRTAHRLQA